MALSTLPFDQPCQFDSANGAVGKVFTSDATGIGSWASPVTGFLSPVAKTTTYAAVANDYVIATGTFTVTSPAASNGRIFGVANPSTGVVTVTAAAGVIRGPGLLAAGQASITLGFPGQRVELISNGTDWFIVGGGQMTAWAAPSFVNSWVDGGAPQVCGYMKDPIGFVHIRGSVKNGINGTTAFTLPAKFCPGQTFDVVVGQVSTPGSGVLVTSAGLVEIFAGAATTTAVSLDGISFLAEN